MTQQLRQTGIVVGSRNISEHKRGAEALGKPEQKYRDIFENAAEGIFQTTADGRFITANPALAHMLGFSSADGRSS